MFLKLLRNTSVKEQIQNRDILTKKLELQVEDLIDLGDDPVTFIFVGDIENPSFSKTISFILTGKKFRKNVEKSKVQTKNILLVSLDQVLGNLEVLNALDDLEMSE